MAPAEGEDLPGEGRGALRGLADLLQVFAVGVVRPQVEEYEAGVALNGREQVVEIVRHPAGEAPQRFQLLRLPELALQPLAAGDVSAGEDDLLGAGPLLGMVADRLHAAPPAVRVAEAERDRLAESRPLEHRLQRGPHRVHVVGVDEVGQGPAGDLRDGPAQDARQGRAGEADPEAGIEREDHIRPVLQQHPEPLLPGAEGGRDGPQPGRGLVDGVAQDAQVVRAR